MPHSILGIVTVGLEDTRKGLAGLPIGEATSVTLVL